jgi:hypothetical protein
MAPGAVRQSGSAMRYTRWRQEVRRRLTVQLERGRCQVTVYAKAESGLSGHGTHHPTLPNGASGSVAGGTVTSTVNERFIGARCDRRSRGTRLRLAFSPAW